MSPVESVDTITVKSANEKQEQVYEEIEDKNIAAMKEKISRLTERVVRMEHHTHH